MAITHRDGEELEVVGYVPHDDLREEAKALLKFIDRRVCDLLVNLDPRGKLVDEHPKCKEAHVVRRLRKLVEDLREINP